MRKALVGAVALIYAATPILLQASATDSSKRRAVAIKQPVTGADPSKAPAFTSAGIVNSASLAAGISPGGFITIFGENLFPGLIRGTSVPSLLDSVRVTIAGKPAYPACRAQNPGELTVLLPADAMQGPVDIKVTTAHGSATAIAELQKYAPGFFTSVLDHKYIAATHADGVPVASLGQIPGMTSRPAEPGTEIMLWGTGFGPTAEPVPVGEVLTRAYPLVNSDAVKVTIGGKAARTTFAGVTIAGVYQINVVVPPELADGDHIVQAEIFGSRTQNNVFIPVRRPTQTFSVAVFYRLDPWLVSNNYQGELWASPPVLGPTTQGTPTFAVEAKVQGLDANGNLVDISPQWIVADPTMVTVSPREGTRVTITVLRAGQSSLRVTSPQASKDLVIKAVYQGNALQVEIAQ